MLPVVVRESSPQSAQPLTAIEALAATDMLSGWIQIHRGKTSIRIEGVPDPAVLRSVLDCILR